MEKRCEFCMGLRAVVVCESDAAQLCLSCDAKVHTANALSYKHPRTLVCQSCRNEPALLRCLHHHIFVCRTCACHCDCDCHSHNHNVLSSYVGCPSAKDLAHLWGFQIIKQSQIQNDESQILHQILDLERLQLSLQPRGIKERPTSNKDPPHQRRTTDDSLESPFPHLDSFTTSANPINADPFSHPLHNYDNQIWAQNMQDLGVCDEVECFEDVNIPDVDLTFTSFEDLFASDNDHPSTNIEQNNDIDKEMAISVSLFSGSRITCESSGSHSNKDELSPTFPRHVSCDVDDAKSGGKENATMRNKEKKALRHEKQAQYSCPRSKSDFKRRGKSQVLKVEGDCGSVTGSF